MGKKNSKSYSRGDHIFAISTVTLMCAAILSVPFLCFFLVIYIASLTSDVYINSENTTSSIKIIFKFFITTVVVTGIVDILFSKILILKKGILSYVSETLLMFAFFYLYVLVYSSISNDILLKGNGYIYVSSFLLLLYLLLHVVYFSSKRIYSIMVKKNN